MPFIFNGVTIPENVANAFSFNGTDITDVFFNGLQVWNQSLGPSIGWSGSSILTGSGLDTSGFSYKSHFGTFSANANWLVADSNGLANGSSTYTYLSSVVGISTTPSTIILVNTGYAAQGTVTYSPTTKTFAGSATLAGASTAGLTTSGGLLAAYTNSGSTLGPWISLT